MKGLLSAYFGGDGSCHKEYARITAFSVSRKLLEDIEEKLKNTVLLSSVLGIVLQFGLHSLSVLFEKKFKSKNKAGHLVGWAALAYAAWTLPCADDAAESVSGSL